MKRSKKLFFFSSAILATSVFVAPMAEASTYIVSKGDTLTKIAKDSNTTVDQLKTWNQLSNDKIFIGQQLVVNNHKVVTTPKTKEKLSLQAKEPTVATTTAFTTYEVVKGDTLTKIAKKYRVNVSQLTEWNALQSDKIFVGQTLKISQGTEPIANNDSSNKILLPIAVWTPIDVGPYYKYTKPDSTLETELEPVPEVPTPAPIKDTDKLIEEQLKAEKLVTTSPTEDGEEIYEEVIELANSLIGTPYLFAGNTPAGFDCSGFVRYVYSNGGLDIERKSSKDYFEKDTTIVDDPVPGDVVFFKDTYISGISHMGIYIGEGQFIHAGEQGVEISTVDSNYWKSKFVAFKRFNEFIQ